MHKIKRGLWSEVGVALAVISVLAGICIGTTCNLIRKLRYENEHLDLGPTMNAGNGEK